MKINIQSRGFKLSKASYGRVKSKLYRVLNRYDNRIRHAEITLSDVNGPKGGEDMKCLINIRVNKSKSIVVQETAVDIYDAINSCTQRVKRVVERHFVRTRRISRRRSPVSPMLVPEIGVSNG